MTVEVGANAIALSCRPRHGSCSAETARRISAFQTEVK
jgi:hypothetical protein